MRDYLEIAGGAAQRLAAWVVTSPAASSSPTEIGRPPPEASAPATPHSQDYFGDSRNSWWNDDFVALMAQRLGWARRTRVLDVGCGAGHWTRTIAPHLAANATITAVDRDPVWSDGNVAWARKLTEQGTTVAIHAGDVTALPFPDSAFDFVTCQTVLIHVADPRRALREMLRVLAPGGLLLCVEPDNFGIWSSHTSLSGLRPVEAEAALFTFALTQQRGRHALGLGNLSLGGILPQLFAEVGAVRVRTFLSDKAIPLVPPYVTEGERALIADIERWFTSGQDFTVEHARKLFLAGGGADWEFDALWQAELAARNDYREAVRNRTYAQAGGGLMYLVSGERASGV